MSDISYLLNGVDAQAWRVQRDSLWRPPVSARSNLLSIPGKHGNINPGLPEFDEPQIPLVFSLRARKSQADLETQAEALLRQLGQPDLVLTRVSGEVTASAPARLISVAHSDFLAGWHAKITAIVGLPSVFLRGKAVESKTFPLGAAEVGSLAGSTAPIPDAVIRVSGPATKIVVADPRYGTGLSWSGSLAAGQYLYLDAGSLRSWVSGSASAWTPGAQAGVVDYPAGGILQLWPDGGGKVKASVAGVGTSSATSWAVYAGKSYL